MGGQTSKGSFGMKERSAPALQGERVVKNRLHGKIGGGGPGREGKREEWSVSLLFLKSTRYVLNNMLFFCPEVVVLISSFGEYLPNEIVSFFWERDKDCIYSFLLLFFLV